MDTGKGSTIINCDSVLQVNTGSPDASMLSRFAARIERRYGGHWHLIGTDAFKGAGFGEPLAYLIASGLAPAQALRVLRQLVVAKMSALDDGHQLSLEAVTGTMTRLAEFALGVAHTALSAQLNERHGPPQAIEACAPSPQLWVVAMGKFGARELNVSSDIDLIYLYDSDGNTGGRPDGTGVVSNHEYFVKLAKGLQTWIADVTEHGFVFRIDLALRPHGNSGPVACSLAALENYLFTSGREWERFAWLKSRVVCPVLTPEQAKSVRELVTPFVYRRYLDYRVFDALRDLHEQIRGQATRRAAGKPQRAHDVKLARGGIREIEFLVQLLQVVRGGQFPELRTRATLKGLHRLAQSRLLTDEAALQLANAYRFLRGVEHRIQYLDDAQSHTLPVDDADLRWVSERMGFASPCELLARFDEHRELVASEFDRLLGAKPDSTEGKCKACKPGLDANYPVADHVNWGDEEALHALKDLNLALAQRVQSLADSPRRRALNDANDKRLRTIVSRVAMALRDGQCSESAALRFLDWLDPLLRRESYLALLVERPSVQVRLLKVLGSSRWAARYLATHPSVVDELASEHWLTDRFDGVAFAAELQARRTALALGGETDDEALMNLLRRAQHAEVFRTLARDVNGHLSVEQVADDLSALADCVLQVSLNWIWQSWWQAGSAKAHQEMHQLGVVAYGKLGGKELGYGSDLDLVFVHDDPHERAQECYAALVKKLINWLTTKTAQGDLYDIDTALRPNGSAGLLVIQMDAYEQYQSQRGSNAAWTWEHQAITRARMLMGTPELIRRFDLTRRLVLCSPREHAALRQEIAHMRERMRQAHPVPAPWFELKHSSGGMIDVEFAVQLMVLAHAQTEPQLQLNAGNMALLEAAQQGGVLPAGIGHAAALAYRDFRQAQHTARLDELSTRVNADVWLSQRLAVAALWQALALPTPWLASLSHHKSP